MEFLYWHWVVLGIGLVLLELIIPSFTALWFGLGAIVVGLVLVVDPAASLTFQIACWAIVSAVLTLLWFKFLKPSVKHTGSIEQKDIEGETGLVIVKPLPHKSGTVRFSTPLLGIDEWAFTSDDQVEIGDQVQVIDINEHVLKVIKK